MCRLACLMPLLWRPGGPWGDPGTILDEELSSPMLCMCLFRLVVISTMYSLVPCAEMPEWPPFPKPGTLFGDTSPHHLHLLNEKRVWGTRGLSGNSFSYFLCLTLHPSQLVWEIQRFFFRIARDNHHCRIGAIFQTLGYMFPLLEGMGRAGPGPPGWPGQTPQRRVRPHRPRG